jgi:hypothetical protein
MMNAMKRLSQWMAAVVLLVSALAVAADRPSQSEKLGLARLTPRGALAYVQVRDLGALFADWRGSKLRERYYASDSYRAFTRSRLYAKLQERLAEFERGAGFTLTEARAAEMSGGLSAAAMYDMGKLEIVFITETSAAKAAATSLFKQSARFEARTRAGRQYYAQEIATDGGRLNQALCFASANGKFIIATTEPLMQRTLENFADGAASDRLSDAIAPTLAAAADFTPHAVTLWTDVPRLREHKYFNLYWIHGKGAALDGVAATLTDLEITPSEIRERRFSLPLAAEAAAPARGEKFPLATLLPLLAADAQFADLRAAGNDGDDLNRIARVTTQILFPTTRPATDAPQNRAFSLDETNGGATGGARYRTLDQRFDRDVDDPGAAPTADASKSPASPDPMETEMRGLLEKAEPKQFAILGRARAEADSPFVRIDRAIVIETGKPFDAMRYERLVSDALFRRLLVAGTVKRIEWRTSDGGVGAPLAGVIEQGGAYAVAGDVLILANSASYCETIVKTLKSRLAPDVSPDMKHATRFAALRFDQSLASYRQLIRLIDFTPPSSGADAMDEDGESSANEPVPFMSRNLVSLLSSVGPIGTVTAESASLGRGVEERLTYRFTAPAPARNGGE